MIVLEDDIGGWKDGYESYRTASVQYFFSKESKLDLCLSRSSRNGNPKDLQGSFIDLYATAAKILWGLYIAWGWKKLIFMETNRISNETTMGLLVRSFGTIGEGIGLSEMGSLKLRSGFASGDSDSSDSVYSTFTLTEIPMQEVCLMYTNLHVKSQSANLQDPEHAGQPPDGVDSLITEGAIRQAMFVQPILQYNVNDWSDVALGSVLAGTVPVQEVLLFPSRMEVRQ